MGMGATDTCGRVMASFGAVVALDYPALEEELAILEFLGGDRLERSTLAGMVELASVSRSILEGSMDADIHSGLTNIPPDLAAAVAERAALTTAELVLLTRGSRSGAELVAWYRRGVLEGATPEVERVLLPVLAHYGLA